VIEYEDLEIGEDYFHHEHGRVTLVGPHPWDGCCLVIVFVKEDEFCYADCERHDLDELLVAEETE